MAPTATRVPTVSKEVPLKKVKAEEVSADVLELIPEEAAANYKMMPLSRSENFIQIGMVYPENVSAQNALRFLANQEHFSYKICLITLSNLAEILKQKRNISIETKRALKQLDEATSPNLHEFYSLSFVLFAKDLCGVVAQQCQKLKHEAATGSQNLNSANQRSPSFPEVWHL